MKKIVSCLVIILVVLLSFFYAHIDKNSYIYDRNADTSSFYGTGILLEGQEIVQTFVAEENTIDGINIKIATHGNVDGVFLLCKVLDENKEEVGNVQVKSNDLESNKFNQIAIPSIFDTKGKQYTLVLSVENSDDLNGISFYIAQDNKEGQQLTVKDSKIEDTLVVRTISHRFDMETYVVLLGIIVFIMMFMKILYKIFE